MVKALVGVSRPVHFFCVSRGCMPRKGWSSLPVPDGGTRSFGCLDLVPCSGRTRKRKAKVWHPQQLHVVRWRIPAAQTRLSPEKVVTAAQERGNNVSHGRTREPTPPPFVWRDYNETRSSWRNRSLTNHADTGELQRGSVVNRGSHRLSNVMETVIDNAESSARSNHRFNPM